MLGEFVLPAGGAAWTATLVATMGAAGIAESNARQAITRLADQGLICSEPSGRRVRWQLSDQGRDLLTHGTARIYGFLTEPTTWDGQWLILTFSVPEERRASRILLRQRLGRAGFGFPGAGVAVSTHLDREAVAVDALRDLGIDEGAMVFRGRAGALAADADVVRRAWDLVELSRLYEQFLDRFGGLRPRGDRETVAALTHLVHEWRRFPFADPDLPLGLLPRRWPGPRARQLFDRRHARWVEPARTWFDAADRAG